MLPFRLVFWDQCSLLLKHEILRNWWYLYLLTHQKQWCKITFPRWCLHIMIKLTYEHWRWPNFQRTQYLFFRVFKMWAKVAKYFGKKPGSYNCMHLTALRQPNFERAELWSFIRRFKHLHYSYSLDCRSLNCRSLNMYFGIVYYSYSAKV